MIQTIFPVNILVKDYDRSPEWTNDLTATALGLAQEFQHQDPECHPDDIPFFTEYIMNRFPEVADLREMFIDSFYELAQSWPDNRVSREDIAFSLRNNLGKLTLMQKNDYKSVHKHVISSAYAVFYLTDVDNQQQGGQLVLHDPSWHMNWHFHGPAKHTVETRCNRMVVAPSYVWHEVTPYFGQETRIAVIMNLDLDLKR